MVHSAFAFLQDAIDSFCRKYSLKCTEAKKKKVAVILVHVIHQIKLSCNINVVPERSNFRYYLLQKQIKVPEKNLAY